MKLNVPLLEKVAKAIEQHPKNTDMNVFVDHASSIPECGTVGCIAGWILAEAKLWKLRRLSEKRDHNWYHREAAKKIGVTIETANSLFYTDFWPQELKRAYATSDVADMMVKRIRQFIKEHKS